MSQVDRVSLSIVVLFGLSRLWIAPSVFWHGFKPDVLPGTIELWLRELQNRRWREEVGWMVGINCAQSMGFSDYSFRFPSANGSFTCAISTWVLRLNTICFRHDLTLNTYRRLDDEEEKFELSNFLGAALPGSNPGRSLNCWASAILTRQQHSRNPIKATRKFL